MKIDKLLELIDSMPEFRSLVERLEKDSARALVIDAAKPYFLAALFRKLGRPMLIIAPRPDSSRKLAEQINNWLGGAPVKTIPEPDALPYQRVTADISTELELLEALAALSNPGPVPPLVVTSAPALTRLLPDAAIFRQSRRTVKKGDNLDPLKLMEQLASWGYSIQNLAELPGQAARRGGIVDVFPPTSDMPVRLEFFGNTVDSLRLFEAVSQRSLKPVQEVSFGPASQTAPVFQGSKQALGTAFAGLDLETLNYEEKGLFEEALTKLMEGHQPDEAGFYAPLFNRDNLFSYLPEGTLAVLDDLEGVRRELAFVDEEAGKVLADKQAEREIPPGFPRPHQAPDDLFQALSRARQLTLAAWQSEDNSGDFRLKFEVLPSYAGQLPRFTERLKDLLAEQSRIIVVSHQSSRLADLLARDKIELVLLDDITQVPEKGVLTLVQGILAGGWVMDDTFLFTDTEVFGFLKQQRQARRRPVSRRKLYVDVRPGDYVVHIEHGIGKFTGVITRVVDGLTREYMVLAYAEDARLYVPTDQIDRVARYVGAADGEPALSRLGSMEWVKSKERARAAAEEIARDLLNLYAARELTPGFVYSPDNNWQLEMEAAFPYIETPDQLTAIAQIKEDMAKPKPMDRLVTGDVGYGKTEVALRAAFKAVTDGKQVAVLVPTTVLAQQHFTTFSERLAAFPVKVEMLSRFRSAKEQKEVIEQLAEGKVDIVIGTHRLIQKDVVFKDLGLVIIDEEQRFGVSHKEYFKKLREEVGVLTLSATPIPRTLHMSLVGVRDMSVMETPPEERLPIKTYVAEYDDRLVREAIVRELERNGQVFFVHNRVQSIGIIAEKLRKLIPEAAIAVGHGQMPEDMLEEVMAEFTTGKVDVLLCTTIIESGLDVPNANTLIVNQADRLGLTQLYQLRGRVGRGANLAYAYFLYDKGKRLTEDAGKRLRTIFEATELGAGFGIAMKDLEIRGAGNILGMRQSGHINAVGFSYYTQLLSEAVEDLKAERAAQKAGKPIPKNPHLPPPTIDLPEPAYIPEDYIPDNETRLSLYQCLAGTHNLEAVSVWVKDFKDRFGEPPGEVTNLLYAIKIKILATKAGLSSVSTEAGDIVLRRPRGLEFDMAKLKQVYRSGLKLAPFQVRITMKATSKPWQAVLEELLGRMG